MVTSSGVFGKLGITRVLTGNALGYLPELDGEIAEDTSHLSHKTWRDPAGADLESTSLLGSFHHADKC